MSNSVDPDETTHISHLIWIYIVCKSLLLSPVAVKELKTFRRSESVSFSKDDSIKMFDSSILYMIIPH